jgi:hypothetical protein
MNFEPLLWQTHILGAEAVFSVQPKVFEALSIGELFLNISG